MNPVDQEKAREWASTHHVDCACGANEFLVGAEVLYIRDRRQDLPVLPITCKTCARVQLFAAKAIGLPV